MGAHWRHLANMSKLTVCNVKLLWPPVTSLLSLNQECQALNRTPAVTLTCSLASLTPLACVCWCFWPSTFTACISTPNIVRHDICRHTYAVERGLAVGFCGQPHYCKRSYYQTTRFRPPRHTWSLLNCFWTCRANLHRWGLAQSPSCDSDQRQTINHIVDTCPLTKSEGRLNLLHEVDDDAACGWNPQRLQQSWDETATTRLLIKEVLFPLHLLFIANTLISYDNLTCKRWRWKLVPCLDHWWEETVLTMPTTAAAQHWPPQQRHRLFLYLSSPTSLALYHTCSSHSSIIHS